MKEDYDVVEVPAYKDGSMTATVWHEKQKTKACCRMTEEMGDTKIGSLREEAAQRQRELYRELTALNGKEDGVMVTPFLTWSEIRKELGDKTNIFGKGCVLNCKHCHTIEDPVLGGIRYNVCDLNAQEDCIANGYKLHEFYEDSRED